MIYLLQLSFLFEPIGIVVKTIALQVIKVLKENIQGIFAQRRAGPKNFLFSIFLKQDLNAPHTKFQVYLPSR